MTTGATPYELAKLTVKSALPAAIVPVCRSNVILPLVSLLPATTTVLVILALIDVKVGNAPQIQLNGLSRRRHSHMQSFHMFHLHYY